MIVSTAAMCMALTIYHEARGEQIPGQYAVAQVLMNRAKGDSKRVCPEAFRHRQFSWANSGVIKIRAGTWHMHHRHIPGDEYAWWKAQRIAQVVLSKKTGDFSRGATYYHTVDVRPSWRLAFKRTHRMGRHIFYA